jgi:RHS repeat-associated protein
VVNSYTYDPYGNAFTAETTENAYNPFMFTGQWYDAEIDQYYLRARQYAPQLMRFTTRDPIDGEFAEPLTLHKYLYTANEPVNRTDLSGEFYGNIASGLEAMASVYATGINIATAGAENNSFELIEIGAFITQLSKLAFVIGMASPAPGGLKVGDLLKKRKGSIKNAPLPKGSPSWQQISGMTLDEIEEAAKKNGKGYKTILKLLKDGRFKK